VFHNFYLYKRTFELFSSGWKPDVLTDRRTSHVAPCGFRPTYYLTSTFHSFGCRQRYDSFMIGCGDGIWTHMLNVMSVTSYQSTFTPLLKLVAGGALESPRIVLMRHSTNHLVLPAIKLFQWSFTCDWSSWLGTIQRPGPYKEPALPLSYRR